MTQPTSFVWQGRIDDEKPSALTTRLHQCINTQTPSATGTVLIGFDYDQGVKKNQGRVGAKKGPDHIRTMMANLPWNKQHIIYDSGNINSQGSVETTQKTLATQVTQHLDDGHFPFILGGGHEVAFGSWLGAFNHIQKKTKDKVLGIINFDAHFDLRSNDNGASSGTPFYQVAQHCQQNKAPFHYACYGVSDLANTALLFERAQQWGVDYLQDHQMQENALPSLIDQLDKFIQKCDSIYLTIDLDVLPAPIAPGVSAPATPGVSVWVIEKMIQHIQKSKKLLLADIAECNPKYDIDNRTARIAARLFHRIMR